MMNILHYSLGFPPYRTGGMTKFCFDLMKEQIKSGNKVSLIWPGRYSFFQKGTKIKKHSDVNGIGSYEVINPNPVSYDEGISDIESFIAEGDAETYDSFLKELRPDVIHVHTLMGLHENLLLSAKKLNIRLVFTTHDFFPICPKVTLYRDGSVCDSVHSCEKCAACNATALSMNKIKLLQSVSYRHLKDTALMRMLRKRHRDNYFDESNTALTETGTYRAKDYLKLRGFYNKLIKLMDVIHYNSNVTKSVYRKYMDILGADECVMPISHSDIGDHKIIRSYEHKLRITYLGAQSGAKGYFMLRKALDKLWSEGKQSFLLNIYFEPVEAAPYMVTHKRYSYNQLGDVLEQSDVVIVPSICYETFGYTVLEALSYGVPVIISDHVGAKDIVNDNYGIIISDMTVDSLKQAVEKLNEETLERMNKHIVEDFYVLKIDEVTKNIHEKLYI